MIGNRASRVVDAVDALEGLIKVLGELRGRVERMSALDQEDFARAELAMEETRAVLRTLTVMGFPE